MLDDVPNGIPPQPAGPFTAASLGPILNRVLKQGHPPSWEDRERLAGSLNLVCRAFVVGKGASHAKEMANRVRASLTTLVLFFEQRKAACFPAGDVAHPPSATIVASEMKLYERFQEFMLAMREHDFQLDGDGALLSPTIENWRHIAWVIAGSFKEAMARNNQPEKFGWSNDGPIPRFVAAVIPLITGEEPSVANVGKHLKDEARRFRQPGTDGA